MDLAVAVNKGINMKLIYIFYALLVEEKNKELRISGPFIHHRPEVDKIGWPSYIFSKDDYKTEKNFLSKFLRTKNPNKLSIFHSVDIKDPNIDFKCSCGSENSLSIAECNNDYICKACNTVDSTNELIQIGDEHREEHMLGAYEHFENHFKRCHENYNICNRKR